MDNAKQEGYVNWSPILNGTNYYYWKPSWFPSSNIWTTKLGRLMDTPMVTTHDVTQSLKLEEDWFKYESEESNGNYRALNSIFNGDDKNIFRFINTCYVAK